MPRAFLSGTSGGSSLLILGFSERDRVSGGLFVEEFKEAEPCPEKENGTSDLDPVEEGGT